MDVELKIALITIAGTVASIIVTIVFNAIASKYNYSKLFAETVSGNRMDWINVWRENVSAFLAASRVLHSFSDRYGKEFDEYVYKQQMAKEMVITRLNLKESQHSAFLVAIENVDYTADEKSFCCACNMVEILAREILKPEWERVKREAKGKKE